MATNTSICGICSLRQITQTSYHWCPQCEEALCNECRDHHKLLKVTRSHELIPISDYKSIPSFITDLQQSCTYHDEQYQQYCVDHALAICFKCITDHRTCHVTTLEKVINNVKTSEQFLDLESRLGDLLQNIDQIKKNRNSNVTKIEETKTRLVKEIRQKRAEINKRLDNLEKQIIKDLDEKADQNCKSIQKVLSAVKEKEIIISKCQANFQKMKQYASDLQTFLVMNEIEVKVYENEQYLQSLKEANSLVQLDLAWKVDSVLEHISNSLKNFGSIEMRTQTSSLEFIRSKNKQAQLQVVSMKKTIDDVKLILQMKITTDGKIVRGCCMSKEGDLLFTDHCEKKSRTVFESDNKHDKLKYKIKGFDVTMVDEKTVAITSGESRMKDGIDIIDIKNQRKIKFIELPGRTYGITRDHDSLYVCVEGRVILTTAWTSTLPPTPPLWDEPCFLHNVIESTFDRTVNYTLQNGEQEYCDNMYGIHTEGWYKFSGNEDVLTKPPKPRQCGSATPIWFDGQYPTRYAEVLTVTACMVGNDTDCEHNWNVSVMHCGEYNVAYYGSPQYHANTGCGRYCMEYTNDPCSNYSVIDYDFTRHQDYYDDTYMHNCDYQWPKGWYYFEGGFNLSTTPAKSGQCGSYNPIWINETIDQTVDTDMVYLRACESYSYQCGYTWSIPMMKCGSRNIMYLRQKGMCGRYCLESRNSSDVTPTPSYVWDEPCHWHNVITSQFERSVNYTLQSGEYGECYDMEIYMEGWYKFSGNERIPTYPPKSGQCGSSSPIWLDGTYPTTYGEISSLTACMVGNDTECGNSWNVSVMHCDGYNVAHLKSAYYMTDCGRYCM
ncbi:Hypothetical predicted protein, partial [Mytilus galloprovincialis]